MFFFVLLVGWRIVIGVVIRVVIWIVVGVVEFRVFFVVFLLPVVFLRVVVRIVVIGVSFRDAKGIAARCTICIFRFDVDDIGVIFRGRALGLGRGL